MAKRPATRLARNRFEARIWALAEREPQLQEAIGPLLTVRRCLEAQIKELEGRIAAAAKESDVCTRLMTVPGVGPMTALSFVTAIDDPARFRKSEQDSRVQGNHLLRMRTGCQ